MVIAILKSIIVVFEILMLYTLIKLPNASNNQNKIMDAIYTYDLEKVHNAKTVEEMEHADYIEFDDMESLTATVWRLWDWGYKNIVNPEIYEKIKDYIEE